MLCVPAEIEIDNESIVLQMQKVREAGWKLEEEMSKLRHMIDGTQVREKGGDEDGKTELD